MRKFVSTLSRKVKVSSSESFKIGLSSEYIRKFPGSFRRKLSSKFPGSFKIDLISEYM